MRTAAIHFADVIQRTPHDYDLLFVSDYLNLAELQALITKRRTPPCVVFFHENQLTYPLQPGERRDHHFALTHAYAMRVAEHAVFNSEYHRRTFLDALDALLSRVPDVDMRGFFAALSSRTSVLPLGLDAPLGSVVAQRDTPTVLWNHRWEYDKNPQGLLTAVAVLRARDIDFRLLLLGQRFRERAPELDALRRCLGSQLVDAGFIASRDEYRRRIAECDIVVSTAVHEFFGLGTLEALRAGAMPVLPNDLAYPELLPRALRDDPRFSYERGAAVESPLAEAIAAVRRGDWLDARQAILERTDHFRWSTVAPRYDALFESIAGMPSRHAAD